MKAIASILSLIAACMAGIAIWVYYPQYQINQLKDEKHTLASEQSETYIDYFRDSEKTELRHVALGDSIIKGYGANPKENLVKTFSESLEKDIRKKVLFQNEGINEITSSELNALVQSGKFDRQIQSADIITLNIGGNDILRLGFEEGFYEAIRSFDTLQTEFNGNLSEILNRVHTLNPEATVLLLELYNPLDQKADLYTVADKFLPKWNVKLYQLAEELDYAVVVDTTAVINGEQPQNLSYDGVHPSGLGYSAIAEQMLNELETNTR